MILKMCKSKFLGKQRGCINTPPHSLLRVHQHSAPFPPPCASTPCPIPSSVCINTPPHYLLRVHQHSAPFPPPCASTPRPIPSSGSHSRRDKKSRLRWLGHVLRMPPMKGQQKVALRYHSTKSQIYGISRNT